MRQGEAKWHLNAQRRLPARRGAHAGWLRLLVWRSCDHDCTCGAHQAAVFAALHFQPTVLTSLAARLPACPRWPCAVPRPAGSAGSVPRNEAGRGAAGRGCLHIPALCASGHARGVCWAWCPKHSGLQKSAASGAMDVACAQLAAAALSAHLGPVAGGSQCSQALVVCQLQTAGACHLAGAPQPCHICLASCLLQAAEQARRLWASMRADGVAPNGMAVSAFLEVLLTEGEIDQALQVCGDKCALHAQLGSSKWRQQLAARVGSWYTCDTLATYGITWLRHQLCTREPQTIPIICPPPLVPALQLLADPHGNGTGTAARGGPRSVGSRFVAPGQTRWHRKARRMLADSGLLDDELEGEGAAAAGTAQAAPPTAEPPAAASEGAAAGLAGGEAAPGGEPIDLPRLYEHFMFAMAHKGQFSGGQDAGGLKWVGFATESGQHYWSRVGRRRGAGCHGQTRLNSRVLRHVAATELLGLHVPGVEPCARGWAQLSAAAGQCHATAS